MDWSLQLQSLVLDPLIPPAPLALVGRDGELSHLKERLRREAVIALNGLPGVGKTTLAVALAHDPEIRAQFPDGVLWAALGTSPDRVGHLRRWAALLGIYESQRDSWSITTLTQVLRSALEQRRMLLVIDDAWTIDEALAFHLGGPRCACLVTTRSLPIATHLAPDNPILLHELNTEDSLDLLHLLAPRVVEDEATRARVLVEAVGGLPLALTLMGNYLRWQAYSGQSRRIQQALERLNLSEARLHLAEPRSPFQRHPSFETDQLLSLHSVIALTDQHLSQQARAALFALGVLPHKPEVFSRAAALAVGACGIDVLDSLIDMGLLESASDGYYTLHQTISDYARLHLQGIAPHERLIQYAHDVLVAHRTNYELLDRERSTLLMALETASTLNRQAVLIQLACAIAPFLLLRGNYKQARLHLDRAYQATLALDDRHGLVKTYLYLGELAGKQGDYPQSQTLLEQGVALARSQSDPEHMCALLSLLGRSRWKQGHYRQAEVILQEGLTLARQISDQEQMGALLATLGAVTASTGDYTRSETFLEEGLQLARQIDDRKQLCTLLMNLGATITEQGRYVQATLYFQEGLALARQIGQYERTSALLCNLGAVATLQGNYAQAEAYQREGLNIARQIGHREWVSILLLNLGETAAAQGRYVQATLYFQETVKQAQQLGRPQLIARALYEQGNLHLKQQEFEEAEATFHRMLGAIPQGDLELHTLAQYGFARICATQGDIAKARELGEASAAVFEGMGHHEAKQVRQWLHSLLVS